MGPYTQHPEAARGQLQYMPHVSRCRVHLEPHAVSGHGSLAVVALRELWDPALSTGIRTVHRYFAWPGMPVFCDCQAAAVWAPRLTPPVSGASHGVLDARGYRPADGDFCGPMGCGPVGGAWEWRCRMAGRPGAGCQARDGPSLLAEWDDEGLSLGSLSEPDSSSAEGEDDSDDEGGEQSSSSDETDEDF